MTPAGFWHRYAAWSLDAALMIPVALAVAWPVLGDGLRALPEAFDGVSAVMAGLLQGALVSGRPPGELAAQWARDPALAAAAAGLEDALQQVLLSPLLGYAAVALGWSLVFERSPAGATPGKRALGLRVVGDAGQRLAAGHVLVRFGCAGLSWLLANIGHLLAALPPRHLALQDRLSGTRVIVAHGSGRMPAWARCWVALQLLVALAGTLWAATALATALVATLGTAIQ